MGLAGTVLSGEHTPGLATTPTVVLSFTWWPHRELRRAGVEQASLPSAALLLAPLSIGAAQAAAAVILRVVGAVCRGWRDRTGNSPS